MDVEVESVEAIPSPESVDEHVFYRPSPDTYKPRKKAVNEEYIEAVTTGWPLSDAFASSKEPGSMLENKLPWQVKWYHRFVPPKTPEELQIGQHWRYEAPRLEEVLSATPEKSTMLTPTSLPGLKSMATKVLSGILQDTLAQNSYQKASEGRTNKEGAGSTVSSQLRMPEGQGGTKRSILEAYTSEKEKAKTAKTS
ncbi:DNA gyrase B subunit, putative [Babesia ovata]|uniref:DNA gyrase B subunit, putative n=1 Tax=Babesia ovata TaxID=189622 RepID=A0A2H6KGN3_9APIC|nr:DNA gyrase B subunit, putative [Babesia ovata]GBE62141.1 DNA gyrase B subunit, putative [Babesia ovata]